MFVLRRLLLRRLGPVGVALTAYDVWRRIPKRHRRRLVALARRQVARAQPLLSRKPKAPTR